MPRKQHTHKYIKVETDNNPVWACALAGCNHYMPYHLRHLMAVRKSICWNCEKSFPLDPTALEENKPRCPECRYGVKTSEETLLERLVKYGNEN